MKMELINKRNFDIVLMGNPVFKKKKTIKTFLRRW